MTVLPVSTEFDSKAQAVVQVSVDAVTEQDSTTFEAIEGMAVFDSETQSFWVAPRPKDKSGVVYDVGTGGDVFWYCGYWNYGFIFSRRVDTTMEQVVTNLQQQLGSQQQAQQQLQTVLDAQQASAAQREKCVASSLGRLVGPLEPEHGRGRINLDPRHPDTDRSSSLKHSRSSFVEGLGIQVRDFGHSRGPVVEKGS